MDHWKVVQWVVFVYEVANVLDHVNMGADGLDFHSIHGKAGMLGPGGEQVGCSMKDVDSTDVTVVHKDAHVVHM